MMTLVHFKRGPFARPLLPFTKPGPPTEPNRMLSV